MSKIAGRFLHVAIGTMQDELGADRYALLLSKCPPDSAALLQRVEHIDDWVDSDTWYAVYEVLVRELYAGDHTLLTALARKACDRLLVGWQKAVLRYAWPRLAVNMIVKRWVHSMDEATVDLQGVKGKRELVVKLAGVPRQPAFVYVLRGYVEQVMSYTRAGQVQTSIVDVHPGAFTLVISY